MAGTNCRKCDLKIARSADKLTCRGQCGGVFHPRPDCSGVSEQDWLDMRSANTLEKWICQGCQTKKTLSSRKQSETLNGKYTLNDVVNLLLHLKEENEKLNNNVAEMNLKLDNQSKQLESLFQKITQLETDVSSLQSENKDLRFLLDDQEQYSRRNCLEIHGVPEMRGENVLSEVVKIGRAIGAEIDPNMIDNCHRLGRFRPGSPSTRGIIVKFVRNLDKENVLRCRKVKRNLTSSDLGFTTPSCSIFINENLTARQKILLSSARKLKRTCNIAYVWSKNGKIYLKENDRSAVIPVTSESVISEVEKKCKERALQVINNVHD